MFSLTLPLDSLRTFRNILKKIGSVKRDRKSVEAIKVIGCLKIYKSIYGKLEFHHM